MQNIEIQKWRELAQDENPNSRKLALDLAPAMSKKIQDELILWFLANENYEIKKIIYELLDQNSCEKIAKINEEKIPVSLLKIKDFELLKYTKDVALEKTIIRDAIRKRILKTRNSPILEQIKDYLEIKKCSLKEARIAIEETLFMIKKQLTFDKLSAAAKRDQQAKKDKNKVK